MSILIGNNFRFEPFYWYWCALIFGLIFFIHPFFFYHSYNFKLLQIKKCNWDTMSGWTTFGSLKLV